MKIFHIAALLIVIVISQVNIADCDPKEIKIGVIFPLTGDGSFWGENSRKAVSLALEDLNSESNAGRDPIKLIFEDERCDSKSAVSAAQKLISVDHVSAILGPICSSPTLAVAPLAEKNKIPLISPCSEADAISQAGEYIYRTWPPGGRQATKVADFALKNLKVKTAAILSIKNDFGQSFSEAFRQRFVSGGGTILAEESYAQSETDLRAQILRLKAKDPQVIFLVSYIADGVIAVKQIRQAGMTATILGTSGFDSNDFFKPLQSMAEGIYFAETADDTSAEFLKRFEEKFKIPWPGVQSCASVSYDALVLLATALREAKSEHSELEVKAFLDSVKNFPGISGPITFDRNGDLLREHGMVQYRGGKRVRVD